MTSLTLRYSKYTALPSDTGAGLKYRALPAGSRLSGIIQRTCACISLDGSFGLHGFVEILPTYTIFIFFRIMFFLRNISENSLKR